MKGDAGCKIPEVTFEEVDTRGHDCTFVEICAQRCFSI